MSSSSSPPPSSSFWRAGDHQPRVDDPAPVGRLEGEGGGDRNLRGPDAPGGGHHHHDDDDDDDDDGDDDDDDDDEANSIACTFSWKVFY